MCQALECFVLHVYFLVPDSNIASGSSSPTQPRDIAALKSLLTSTNPLNNSKEVFSQNSLFDEGLRIAQQYGMADFAEELQQLKGDNSNEDLSASKNSNDNSLNQSTENDSSLNQSIDKSLNQSTENNHIEKLIEKSGSLKSLDGKNMDANGQLQIKQELHVNGN